MLDNIPSPKVLSEGWHRITLRESALRRGIKIWHMHALEPSIEQIPIRRGRLLAAQATTLGHVDLVALALAGGSIDGEERHDEIGSLPLPALSGAIPHAMDVFYLFPRGFFFGSFWDPPLGPIMGAKRGKKMKRT